MVYFYVFVFLRVLLVLRSISPCSHRFVVHLCGASASFKSGTNMQLCWTLTTLNAEVPWLTLLVKSFHSMPKTMMPAGCLKATAFVHEEGIVHESIGLGAFMMSTVDDTQADRLLMKLDNFGVAQAYTGASGPDSALAQGIQRDQEALAITFCEIIFGVFPIRWFVMCHST
jgi:hypothetical protein